MNRKFSEILEEYLQERDRQNSDLYHNRSIDEQADGGYYMKDLANEMDSMTEHFGVKE